MRVLMSVDNPNGHKLEELIGEIRFDVGEKSLALENKLAAIKGEPPSHRSVVMRGVLRNNQLIVALLLQIEAVQRSSLDALDVLGPDQGPTGTPRV